MDVHLLWHVRHARNLDGSQVEHRESAGGVPIDVYSLDEDNWTDGFVTIPESGH